MGSLFPTTQWTNIFDARAGAAAPAEQRQALERLIAIYWKPIHFLIRRRGHDPEAAKDLTQGFFATFLERDFLRYVDRARGKFRIFLRVALDHYLADERDRAQAHKRGGQSLQVHLDFAEAEQELAAEPAANDPDRAFVRQWATAVIKRAQDTLRTGERLAGRLAEFEILAPRITDPDSETTPYRSLAARLGLSETDVNNRLHRLRKLYRIAIWNELRTTTKTEVETHEELRALFSAFGEE
jgi:RNA polymerase sigma-70 factor (ECF subfamily)